MRKRRKLMKKWSKITDQSKAVRLKNGLLQIEKVLRESYRKKSLFEETKAVNAIKKNSKYFFSYARRYSKVKTKVGPLLTGDGEYTINSKKMADLLQEQYKSVFSKPNGTSDSYDFHDTQNGLNDILFDEGDVRDVIDEISENAAGGPLGFAAVFLKKCKEAVDEPLYLIWRSCLDNSVTPEILKLSFVIPIHKGGNRGSPANYRPVSLTSHLIKMFEKIIRKRIVEYMDERKLFNHTQHGFRAGRSCLSQLLSHFDKVLTYLEQGFNVDTIYLDFSKAFDKVDHLILMQKLKKIGIGGKIASWIHSYLFHRKQVVIVNGIKSDSTEVVSGVPQGSVLGPLLFIIMLMDIDKSINSSFLSSFADDTRISREIESLADTFKLQNDLNSVYKWAQQNNAEFNDTKFEHLPYGKNNDLKKVAVYLTGEGRRIATKNQTKDLGVIMQTNCSFSDHIKNVVSVTKDLSAWCLRTFNSRSPELMLTLWKQLIVPKLDYCSQLWSPHNSKVDTQEIEMTQRSFIRRIEGMSNYSYWDQLKRLKMYSLERRRKRYIITYVW